MCGIAGQCVRTGTVDERAVARAVEKLAHRGPDGSGNWINARKTAALGHTRLAIIDLETGQQPMFNENGSVVVIFNGEIYNHEQLRRKLTCKGHHFRSRSDTEVLVHLYEEYGPRMVEQLNGMFAFAIWDDMQQTLLLARDRLGQKPLFFSQSERGISFASEAGALISLLGSTPSLNPKAIDDYLTFQYVPGDLCAFSGMEKLQPGEWLQWTPKRIERQRYWSPPVPRPTFAGSFDEAARHLRDLLRDATKLRLMSDVPLGVLLSGGIDSSIVVGLMKESGASSIRTFTASFGNQGPDERPYARAVSQMYGTEHTELEIEPPEEQIIQHVQDLYAEPFADTSAIATYLICQTAREHVTVALTGDGGDESLLGYSRYVQFQRYLSQRRFLYPVLTATGLRALGRWLCPNPGPRTWRRRFRTLTSLWDPPPEDVYLRWLGAFQSFWKRQLCRPEFAPAAGSKDDPSLERVRRGLSTLVVDGDWITAAAAFDLRTYLPDAVLTKVDRASMAVGLECRSPFLDYRVVEFLATLPRTWKLHPRHGSKWILRYACKDLIPQAIFDRGKQGFGSPIGSWFRSAWLNRLEDYCMPRGQLADWLSPEYVARLITEHRTATTDHTYRLWTLACLNRRVQLSAD